MVEHMDDPAHQMATNSDGSMHGGMGPGGMSMKIKGSGMMAMHFHTSVKEYILFQECLTQSAGAMAGACICTCVLAIIYESLKYLRYRIPAAPAKILNGENIKTSDGDIIEMKTIGQVAQNVTKHDGGTLHHGRNCRHIVISALYIVEVLLSYCLMMIAMTFNVWLYLAIGVGATFGYFLFGMRNVVLTPQKSPETGNQQPSGKESF